MLHVFPDYYKHFHCIAGACKHNCCIGWEIDIDPDTLAFYRTVSGAFGSRLQQQIDCSDPPHFRLSENERCPFLNEKNLCDVILTLGEDRLCNICTDHPRFRNELPGRIETGLGLCCEEAARLILSQPEPMRLEVSGTSDPEDEDDVILLLRDEILVLLQDRTVPVPERVTQMLSRCGVVFPNKSLREWAEILLSLERLEDGWTEFLSLLRDRGDSADCSGFDEFMALRQAEYEQFLVYLIYRHFANAFDFAEAAARAAFAALGFTVVHTLGALIWQKTGTFPFAQQVELVRLFSAELEYSEENLETLLELLTPPEKE